jgi:predicted NAD/FAD-binding protein
MYLPDYANLAALLKRYGVELTSKPLSYGTSIGSDAYWGNLPQNVHPAFWERVMDDAGRFTMSIREMLITRPLVEVGQLSFKDFLQIGGYSPEFIYRVAYPMFAIPLFAYDVVPEASVAFIAAMFVDYLEAFTRLSEWCYIQPTFEEYIDKVTDEFRDKVRLNTRITSVTRLPEGVMIEDESGHKESYDQVVFATPGDVTLSLLADPTPEETLILEGLKTRPLKVTLHRDESVLSPYFQDRPIVQFTTHDGDPSHGAHHFDVRRWHGLGHISTPIIASINYDIPPEHIYATRYWDIDRVTPQGMYSRLLIQTIQGINRSWYCGRSVTLPSHEESFISGLVISEYLGVEYPFPDSPQAQKQYSFVKNFVMGEQGKYEAYTPFKE